MATEEMKKEVAGQPVELQEKQQQKVMLTFFWMEGKSVHFINWPLSDWIWKTLWENR